MSDPTVMTASPSQAHEIVVLQYILVDSIPALAPSGESNQDNEQLMENAQTY